MNKGLQVTGVRVSAGSINFSAPYKVIIWTCNHDNQRPNCLPQSLQREGPTVTHICLADEVVEGAMVCFDQQCVCVAVEPGMVDCAWNVKCWGHLSMLVLPQSSSEPWFECELLRTWLMSSSRSSPRFHQARIFLNPFEQVWSLRTNGNLQQEYW